MMINVLLADDQKIVRRGLRMSLALEGDLLIVGEAGDGWAAVELARNLQPDVIVMDVAMPELDGIAATRILRLEIPGSNVVILSLHDDADTRARAAQAGAFAFVAKSAPLEELIERIRQAAATHRDNAGNSSS